MRLCHWFLFISRQHTLRFRSVRHLSLFFSHHFHQLVCLDTPVYPYHLDSIYPVRSVRSTRTQAINVPRATATQATRATKTISAAPNRSYPSRATSETVPKAHQVVLETHYPIIQLCKCCMVTCGCMVLTGRLLESIDPPVYPHNLGTIYPALSLGKKSSGSHDVPVLLPVVYPSFDICE